MLLDVQRIGLSFPEKDVLRGVSFHVRENEKTAVIGVNGAGKSTLFKIIAGELSPDEGQVVRKTGLRMAYLAQHQSFSGSGTIYRTVFETDSGLLALEDGMRGSEEKMGTLTGDALEAEMRSYASLSAEFERRNGYAYRSEVKGVLRGLGFSDDRFGDDPSLLSGGEKTRLSLAKILLSRPELLLLDEPTNHLDIRSIEWLEGYLRSYSGSLLLISHDRYFLNRIVGRVIEIEGGTAVTYKGDYDAYTMKKAERIKAETNAYLADQRRIRHEEAVIEKLRQFNREKSIRRAESREKRLAAISPAKAPVKIRTEMDLSMGPVERSGRDVLRIEDLSKGFDGRTLFSGLDLLVRLGERVVCIGDNGTGKSTFLRILAGRILPDTGTAVFGARTQTAYYDQENQTLDPDNTVFEEIADTFPDWTHTKIRTSLARFLFTGETVFQKVSELSGGERARLSLAKVVLGEANVLLLDEPTNHLDIHAKTALEEALLSYGGTILCVTHDRYFANRIATGILALSGGRFGYYAGHYDSYAEEKAKREARAAEGTADAGDGTFPAERADAAEKDGRRAWMEQKEREARRRKAENDLKRAEKAIDEAEKEIREIDEKCLLPDVATDAAALSELQSRREELERELEALYPVWEELAAAAPDGA